MVNVNLFKAKLVEKGMTIQEFADSIGMDRSKLYRRLQDNGESFLIREVHQIAGALNLSVEEINAIFFVD